MKCKIIAINMFKKSHRITPDPYFSFKKKKKEKIEILEEEKKLSDREFGFNKWV